MRREKRGGKKKVQRVISSLISRTKSNLFWFPDVQRKSCVSYVDAASVRVHKREEEEEGQEGELENIHAVLELQLRVR